MPNRCYEPVTADRIDDQVRAVLAEDERYVGAFVGSRGPRPGSEGLAGLPFVLTLLVTGSGWYAASLAAPVFDAGPSTPQILTGRNGGVVVRRWR